MLALLKVKTVNLSERCLGFGGRALAQSGYKRLQRFFRAFALDEAQLARVVVSWMQIPDGWVLSLDRTTWKFGTHWYNILTLGIVHQGVAFPVLWWMLGAIGEMAHRFNATRLRLDVGVALPFDEYLSDQNEGTKVLSETRSFTYRGQQIEMETQAIKVLPEGAGLVQWRKFQALRRGESADRTYVVVLAGHRDLTFLVFRQGKPPTGEPSGTVRLGYLEYLQSIAQGMCKPESSYLFDALLRGSETVAFPDQPGKVFQLSDRKHKAEAFYWEQIRHHLSDKFAALDFPSYEVLVGGGTALTFLRPKLEEFLTKLPWCNGQLVASIVAGSRDGNAVGFGS